MLELEGTSAPQGSSVETIAEADAPKLTPREDEVLHLMAQSYTYAEMATQMHISKKTIEKHVEDIHERFHTRSSVSTVLAGVRYGYVQLEALIPSASIDRVYAFTRRQKEVLEAIVNEHIPDENKNLAQTLVITIPTVEKHLHKAYRRLGARRKLQTALIYSAAKEQGIV